VCVESITKKDAALNFDTVSNNCLSTMIVLAWIAAPIRVVECTTLAVQATANLRTYKSNFAIREETVLKQEVVLHFCLFS
jgi:hypothetical protein